MVEAYTAMTGNYNMKTRGKKLMRASKIYVPFGGQATYNYKAVRSFLDGEAMVGAVQLMGARPAEENWLPEDPDAYLMAGLQEVFGVSNTFVAPDDYLENF
jgi:hypothetical protein